MSKKNKKLFSPEQKTPTTPKTESYALEYKIIKHDLIKIVALNLVYLAAVLSLYYANLNKHFLENWFAKILHF